MNLSDFLAVPEDASKDPYDLSSDEYSVSEFTPDAKTGHYDSTD